MKQKTRILIYIIIAIAIVIMGTLTILKNHQVDSPDTAQEHIDLGRIYLTELSYEKASLEFTEAIEIEPLNSDAYLGLAEAYVGMGDTEKAIDVLEEGYDKTGDERLKDMLEELRPPEETMVTTAITTEETTTVSAVAMAVVPDLQGLSEEEAIAACETAGLNYSVSYDYSDAIEQGYVIGQTIPVNASVAEGISVPFMVSKGVEVVTTVATTTTTTTVATTTEITTTTTPPVTTTIRTTTTAPAEEFITIKGVKFSTSLTKLDFSWGFELTNEDIKDLDKMVNLIELRMDKQQISDISVLKKLTNLTELNLSDNQITDISVLKDLTNLTELNLSHNQISDISALGYLTNLTKLNLSRNKITDISALKNLTNLTLLDLTSNQKIGTSALQKNLIFLDISALENLTNLTELYLSGNPIADISALGNLTNLTNLSVYIRGPYQFSSIHYCDISVLKKLTKLTRLQLTGSSSSLNPKDVEDLKKALPNCKFEQINR